MNLQNLILDRVDEESLFLLSQKYPSLNIDKEWNRRLTSCDSEIYIPVLDFLLFKNIQKTYQIKSGLYNLRNCFPWKIAVIYDFRSGQVKSVEIRIGKNFGRYSLEGKTVLFSWLDVNENKKMLREIISSNSKSSLFSTKLDKVNSNNVRDLILNNKFLTVDVAVINKNIQSFPGNPLREDFIVYPYNISSTSQNIRLYETNTNIVRFEKVPINFSPEITKYLSLISK